MTHEQFCYWLQGFFELNGDANLTAAQIKSIKEHLQTTFYKITPPMSPVTLPIPTLPLDIKPHVDTPWLPPTVICQAL